MFLYLFMINVFFHQAKMLMFYSVQTTNSTMVGKKNRCTIDSYSIEKNPNSSHTKYHILCSVLFVLVAYMEVFPEPNTVNDRIKAFVDDP